MTDDLIKRDADRLRVFEKWLYTMDLAGMSEEQPNLADIADTLEAQAAEIARLREALEEIAALEDDFESNAAMTSHEWQMFHVTREALEARGEWDHLFSNPANKLKRR